MHLIVVTRDGYGKRLALAELRRTRRGAKGVKISTAPVAATITVADIDATIVIVTAGGKVERLAVRDVPVRHREVRKGGRMSRGVRVIRVAPPDQVAGVGLAQQPPDIARMQVETRPATNRGEPWPGGRVGLEPGEMASQLQVLRPVRTALEITPGGALAVEPASAWAAGVIHAGSRYWCRHCGRQQPDPHAAYHCIDGHARAAARAARLRGGAR